MAPRAKNLMRLLRSWATPVARAVVSKRGRRITALVVLSPFLLLLLLAAVTPLPDELRKDHSFDGSVRVLDRHGKLLAEVRADDGTRARWIPLEQIGPEVVRMFLGARS